MNKHIREGDFRDFNFLEAEKMIRAAAGQGAELVSTFEQFLDGYGFDANKIKSMNSKHVERCEVLGESAYIKRLEGLAKELDIVIVAGLALKEESGTYNSALIINEKGIIGKYRKTHNQNRYATWFAPLSLNEKKENCPSFDIGKGHISIKICNDRHFRETTEYMIENGCELIICPAYGNYDPSNLVNDAKEFGLWAVFVHPRGCQFIDEHGVVFEKINEEGTSSFAVYDVEFRKPSGATNSHTK
jgi:predicted amidohydrolase